MDEEALRMDALEPLRVENAGAIPRGHTGLWALSAVAGYFRVQMDCSLVAHELALTDREVTSKDIVRAAGSVGLKARIFAKQDRERLESIPRPAILRMNDGQYVVLGQRVGAKSEVFEVDHAQPVRKSIDELCDSWAGEIILITRALESGVPIEDDEFGMRWFLPAIWRHRRTLWHIMIASLFIQIFALITPFFFEVIIDRVLVHESLATLNVIVFGLIVIGLFDVSLQYLRTYAIAHTASRLDVEFGRRVFEHLMKLPLSFFDTNATGQIVARVREIETIRTFLTGQGLMSIIDLIFAVVIFGVLLAYSPRLTLLVLGSIIVYVIIAATIVPILRMRARRKFDRGAANQQFLVESVVGAYTLKAAAVEPLMQLQWDERLALYVKSMFDVNMTSSLGWNLIQYASKLNTALILYFGASAVIAREMTVGELIAFNMMAGLLAAPILRLARLWQDIQQVQVSILRLGEVLKTPTEVHPNMLANLPAMQGAVSLRDVYFKYSDDEPDVLHGINLDIPAGQVLGIVGPSGSGKSTLTKLIQRLHLPQQGNVTIDGVDIARVHPAWIRQQIGVVLQENLLFNRTIHENIALSAPHLSRAQVIAIAKLAGADDFIMKLPNGYDTRVVERGANLSGGQRQRIAIARALARNPRLLILDEATSAVDYESERIIQSNLKEIVRDRTVIIIAHRLAAVRHCDRIIGIADGKIVEDGTREELLQREGSLFRHLSNLQSELVKV